MFLKESKVLRNYFNKYVLLKLSILILSSLSNSKVAGKQLFSSSYNKKYKFWYEYINIFFYNGYFKSNSTRVTLCFNLYKLI